MITIIRPGMMVYTVYKFECKTCGCVAEVTKEELWPETRYFNCPYCGNQHECEPITKYKEIKLNGFENVEEYPFVLAEHENTSTAKPHKLIDEFEQMKNCPYKDDWHYCCRCDKETFCKWADSPRKSKEAIKEHIQENWGK